MVELSSFVGAPFLDEGGWSGLKEKFSSAKPFSYLELRGFLLAERVVELLDGICEEEFFVKDADLFSFKQTQDFVGVKEGVLKEFRSFLLSETFISFMETITGFSLKRGVIDLHGSLYGDTDYLLCHDDQLEGRKIAFLFYLTDLDEKDGGDLVLFDEKESGVPGGVGSRIVPKAGTFAFFEVSEKSFHEVSEVLADKQRIAIGGWFHG